jgi:hypothetical protein
LERNVAKYHGDGIIGKAGELYYFDYGWKGYEKIITISKEEFNNLNMGDYCSPTKDFPYFVFFNSFSKHVVIIFLKTVGNLYFKNDFIISTISLNL